MLLLGGAVLLGGAWLIATGLMARSQLTAVSGELSTLRQQVSAGHLPAARRTAADVAARAHRAHELTTGPAWALAAGLPVGSGPFDTVRGITAAADRLGTQVVPALIRTADQLAPSTLRGPDGAIEVGRIAAAAPSLGRADATLRTVVEQVRAEPASTWLGPVDHARQRLLGKLAGLQPTLDAARRASVVAPAMLGQDGPKRYFVAFQNEAESRGTGGIPGTFAIVRADHGKISFERFASDDVLYHTPTGLDFGGNFNHLYGGARATSLFPNSNLSPHFPYAARIWLAMWQQHTHQHLDGAMALDPTALSYLLRVTGPIPLPSGGTLTSDNVVALTQNTLYLRYPRLSQIQQRKQALVQIAKAVSSHITTPSHDTTALLKQAGKAAGGRRILLYSTDPAIERQLAQTPLSGIVRQTSRPYVGVVTVNTAGDKLDYYLHRSITWRRTGCGSNRQVEVTVRFTNTAPGHGLPPYIDNRADAAPASARPGDDRLALYYFATHGASLRSMTIDGAARPAAVGSQRGHPVFVADVELPHGKTTVVRFRMTAPAGTGTPLVLNQPAVHPADVTLHDAPCR